MGPVGLTCQQLIFRAPRRLELAEVETPVPAAGQALVRSRYSAISAGTEMLFYRGAFASELALDENIPALAGPAAYPLRYGYCQVGEVAALGPGVPPEWLGRQVFSFQPHQSCFCAPLEALMPLPDGVGPEDAVFLPNMETAVNLVLDAAPLLGERGLVMGQGVLGLLTTALLLRFPLAHLSVADCYALRRQAALELGAPASLAPAELAGLEKVDFSIELSGSLAGLNQAIARTAFAGRVVVGSWYGSSQAGVLNLGGYFHRSRIRLLSSQVSTLAPALSGNWSKARRFEVAWDMLRQVRPSRWISHRFALAQAQQAYHLLDTAPEQALQVIFCYD